MNKPNVLVITQETATQDELKQFFAEEYDYVTASNGIDGITISRMTKPAVIVLDVHVEHVPAVSVCKALLAQEAMQGIPVLILAETASVEGALAGLANVRGVLQRPFEAEQVKAKIHAALSSKGPQSGAKKAAFKRDEPIRVLSVDDSSVVRKLVTMILTAEGFKVSTAADGLDGINKAKEIKPDIILLDFVMPKMNGFQVCRILQKDERLRKIPVILVTSKGDKVGDKFVDQLGVTGYITKPFQPEELVNKIHQTLENYQPSDEIAETGAVASVEAEPARAVSVEAKPVRVEAVPPKPTPKPAQIPVTAHAEAPSDLQKIVHAEVVRVLAEELETRLKGHLKGELEEFSKTLDKHIEKVVIEKMNEFIRRAKKKD